MYVNLSTVSRLPWSDDSGPTLTMLTELTKAMQPLFHILSEFGCQPNTAQTSLKSKAMQRQDSVMSDITAELRDTREDTS